jgi:hypothetical protein
MGVGCNATHVSAKNLLICAWQTFPGLLQVAGKFLEKTVKMSNNIFHWVQVLQEHLITLRGMC